MRRVGRAGSGAWRVVTLRDQVAAIFVVGRRTVRFATFSRRRSVDVADRAFRAGLGGGRAVGLAAR